MASLLAFSMAIFAIILTANGDITFQAALLDLLPCEPFLVSSGPTTPIVPYCSAVQNLNAQATTTKTRRNLCECFKKAAAGIAIDPTKLKQLPQFCKVSLPVTLDPSIDCSK
ncbi:non-specific lipid-transfer protein 1 [Rosa chinensis]|nr:non-specific lipid-transfer protein 1 [Rosa chinensis]